MIVSLYYLYLLGAGKLSSSLWWLVLTLIIDSMWVSALVGLVKKK